MTAVLQQIQYNDSESKAAFNTVVCLQCSKKVIYKSTVNTSFQLEEECGVSDCDHGDGR